MAKGRRKKRNSKKLRKLTRTRTLSAKPPEELWADRRAGARNIAGVRYQLRLTLTVLVRAAHGQFPASALMPEGMEDIDTLPTRGEKHRFLQAKELGSENRILGMGALADFLEHTIPILRRDPDALGVLITNGFFGGGLEATGWDATLDPTDELTQTLAEVIDGIDADELDAILPRISLVEETADLDVIVHEIASLYAVDPMIAQLALDRCLAIVIDTSAEQAFTSIDKPVTLAINDLQGAVHEAKRAVATSRLSIDDLHGVVAPLTFRVRSQLTERQFLEGVDVRPEHIAADLDVPRSEYLDEIARGIEKTQLVVILGPSGAGKSALLWRAAAEHATKMRVWRVQQLAETHVDVLVAAVEQQRPSSGFPILLCVDDVGRPNRAGWRHAAATLLELQGVYLLAAAREEDFTTEDALRRALIVRPTLNRQTARRIEEILSARGVIPAMAVDEAFPRSRGLLMEFLHLVIAGRRLSAVLAEQAVGLEESTRQTELAVARYVTSAHSVGLEVDAETLDGRLATSELAAALRRLEHEHLLVESVTGTWTGLHELRSTELSQLLHQRPPPRLADTLAQVVTDASTRAAAARLPLIMRTAKAAEPIAAALAARVKGADSTEASVWLEGARLADVSEHARECAAVARRLPLPAALNVQQWLVIACLGRFAGVDLSILPAESRAHAAQLPEPRAQLHRQAASGIDPSEWAERARSADTATRARLLEALEGAVQWDSETATSLAASVPSADSLADARVVASIHRGCRDDAARAGLIASLPSPSQRLQALRDVWPLLTEAEFVPATGVVETRFIHPVNGSESPEARAAELAAVLL
ncbi:MAG: hypothetical protein ABIW84_01705, partial [Ilumatobacteraceae bacterium]